MKKILVSLAFVLLAAVPLSAQTYLVDTTLSSAVTSLSQRNFVLASASGVEVGGQLFVDHELVTVVSISGTTITVNRNARPGLHAASAVVYVATKAQSQTNFLPHNAALRAGVCSSSSSSTPSVALAGQVLPFIDTDTGDIYGCRRNGSGGSWVWNITNVVGVNGAGSIPTEWP